MQEKHEEKYYSWFKWTPQKASDKSVNKYSILDSRKLQWVFAFLSLPGDVKATKILFVWKDEEDSRSPLASEH